MMLYQQNIQNLGSIESNRICIWDVLKNDLMSVDTQHPLWLVCSGTTQYTEARGGAKIVTSTCPVETTTLTMETNRKDDGFELLSRSSFHNYKTINMD